ncbi:type II toxin-antitoxin system death-on-curing family toxin [Bacillus mangrovi]|uniref:Type II toxin-antitoxin system death-on-curing family toxin n=2 Tax=Metabacillus mangrovi TaxID=1491830 RepID=A0A7X2V4X7_9BACI|nr:type II toxin-antitoxin system death-on-curing family toxin [Metabacillus mangrovi]
MMNKYDDKEQAGVKYLDKYQAMLARPQTSVFGEDAFPTLEDKALCYLHSIASQHIFHNGNKRTAATIFVLFLRMHGYDINLSNKELEDYMVMMVQDQKYKTNDWLEQMKQDFEGRISKRG